MSNLYTRHLYTNDEYKFIISKSIKEMDIKAAGMNMLISAGKLSDKQIEYLNSLDKKTRNVKIGLMMKKEPSLNKVKSDGLIKYRKEFFEKNNIEDSNVISIKSDAIFLVNQHIKFNKFDNVEFVEKNRYTSFYNLNRLEFYYSNKKLDIKGINKDVQKIHKKYFLHFLKHVFDTAEKYGFDKTREVIYDFSKDYLNMKLHPEFYREFSHYPVFRLKDNNNYGYKFTMKMKDIDIRYNYLNYIIPLIKIFY